MNVPVLSAQDVLPLVRHHEQGWGSMGLDTCAFGGGATPLPLEIGGQRYENGLGLHAPGETWLALEGRYARFEAEVGVQKQPQNQGSVVFRVYGDDTLLFDSGLLRESDGARPLSVDVTGVRYLRLEYTDGGDGMVCDCANWVNLRFTPAERAQSGVAADAAPVDMVPFGRVLTWNPFVKDGTHAARTEEFPERDLFPGKEVQPGEGTYPIPMLEHPHADIGMGCIGVEWLEQRRITRAEVHFSGAAPSPEGASVEYWAMTPDFGSTPGVSRWQGHWEYLRADIVCEGDTWSVDFPPLAGWKRIKTMKVRWLMPRELRDRRVTRLTAYSDSSWVDDNITLRALQGESGESATVQVYNGLFTGELEGQDTVSWSLDEPLQLSVRHVEPRPWSRAEQTVLRLQLKDQRFGIAVSDVLDQGPVYVEEAGVAAAPTEKARDIEDRIAALAGGKTILEQVRAMPDQTFAQAIEKVHRPEGDYGPTLISLAHGNEKFLLHRSGSLGFDAPGKYDRQKRRIDLRWEGQSDETIQRHLDGGWMPIPVIQHEQNGVAVEQRTFVAPTGNGPVEGMAAWYDDQPLCVAEFSLRNGADEARPVALRLGFTAEAAVSLEEHPRGIQFSVAGVPCALLDATGLGNLTAGTADGGAVIEGAVPGGGTARCVLFIPGWDTPMDALPEAEKTGGLLSATRAHWDSVMAESTQITTPDPMLDNLIRASRVHCILAARNEEGRRIAPWIGSIDYGPLESEAHSLVRGMAFLGHDDFARRGLDFFINRFNDDGYLTTGYTVIGTGWHLWALGEYHALHQNDAWMRENASEVARVCDWIMAQRKKTMHQDAQGRPWPEYGLMPPGVLADWGVYAHYFYLNGNYHAGLQWAGEALRDIGDPHGGAIVAEAETFKDSIRRAFAYVQGQAPVLPLRDGTWVPAYPTQIYSPMPIADLYWGDDAGRSWCYDVELGAHHLVPMGVLDPDAPSVGWMLDHMEDVQFLESGWFYYPKEGNHADWFNLGGFAKVQPFYARNAEVYAMRDDVKPFIRSYFNATVSLLNREDLSLWEHFINGAFNKTHETGYFLHQSRLMFLMERDDALWLAPFLPSAWMADGQEVAVEQAPTFFGDMAYQLSSHLDEGYIEARITPPRRTPPAEIVLRLRHPEGLPVRQAQVTGATVKALDPANDTIHLTPDTGGEIRVVARF